MQVKKNAADFFVGERPSFRLYCNHHMEVYELLTEYQGQTLILEHKELPLGDGLTNFLYEDFEEQYSFFRESADYLRSINDGQDVERHWCTLLNYADMAAQRHPFFLLARQAVCALYAAHSPTNAVDAKALTRLLPQYKGLGKRALGLIQATLGSEREDGQSAVGRYALSGCPPKLEQLTVSPELVQGGAFLCRTVEGAAYPRMFTAQEMARSKEPPALVLTVYPKTPNEILDYLTYYYMTEDVTFRPCKSCGRYFAASGKAEYCNRRMDGSRKTCREMGAMKLYESNKMKNPALRAYTKSYKTHNARIRYGTMTREQFSAWSVEARAMRDKCVSGEIPLDELQDWLDSH